MECEHSFSLFSPLSNIKYSATFYTQNGVAGACGKVNPDSAYIVALFTSLYNQGHCNQKILLTNADNNKQITATVAGKFVVMVDDSGTAG